MNPNLKRGNDSIMHMTIRERIAADMLAAFVTGGVDTPISSSIESRRASLAKEACLLADALIVGLADTRQTKVEMVAEPSFYKEYAADMRRRGLQPRLPTRPKVDTCWRCVETGIIIRVIGICAPVPNVEEPGVLFSAEIWSIDDNLYQLPLTKFHENFVCLPKPVAAPPVSLDQAADKDHLTVCEPPC